MFKEIDKVVKEFFDYVEDLFPDDGSDDGDYAYDEVGYNPYTGCYEDDL